MVSMARAADRLLALAQELSGDESFLGGQMLLVAAGCLAPDRASFLEAAEDAWDDVIAPHAVHWQKAKVQ